MIRDFIGGKRIEYFRPFQTLFILAALYIMAVQLVDPEALSKKAKTEKTEQTDKEEIIAAKEKLTQKMEKTYSKEEKRSPRHHYKKPGEKLEQTGREERLHFCHTGIRTEQR